MMTDDKQSEDVVVLDQGVRRVGMVDSEPRAASLGRRRDARPVRLAVATAAALLVHGMLGCRRHDTSGGDIDAGVARASSSSPVAPDAPLALDASPTAAPVVRVALVVRADAKGAAGAHAVAESVDLDEQLANVAAPHACTSRMEDGVWSVSCTPKFREVLLALRMTTGGLSVERRGAPARTLPAPSGAVLIADDQVVGERDLHPCDADGGDLPLAISVNANENVNDRTTWLQLVAGKASLTLATVPPKCELETEGDRASVACGGRPVCSLTARGAIVDIACERPAPAHGSLVAPCGWTPSVPSRLGRTWANYH